MITILLIEDDINIQEALREFLGKQEEFELVGAFSNAEKFRISTWIKSPDVVLLDINLPGTSGIELIPEIKIKFPNVSILMLSVNYDNDSVFKSLQAGADGYLSKETPLTRIKDAIIDINNGGSPITPAIARKVFDFFNAKQNITEDLSEREKKVVDGIVAGLSYKLVADNMNISIDTVRKHIKNIYRKLQINSKGELIARYHGKK